MWEKYRVALWLAFGVVVGGCAYVGLQHMMPIGQERDQKQKKHGALTVELADSVLETLPEDAPPQVVDSVKRIRDIGEDVQVDAIKSERWHAAGEKIVGPPPFDVDAGSDQEDAVLGQTEQDADTLGKGRAAVSKGKAILAAAASPGGIGGWLTGGGLMTLLAAGGTAVEVGRRKLKEEKAQREKDLKETDKKREQDRDEMDAKRQKEREEDLERHRKIQEDRDEAQDLKLEALTTMLRGELAKLKTQTTEPTTTDGAAT